MSGHPHTPSRSGLQHALAWIVEGAFVVDMLLVGLTAAALFLARINPLSSPLAEVIVAVTVAIAVIHRYWMRRHRDVMVDKHGRAATKERRGF